MKNYLLIVILQLLSLECYSQTALLDTIYYDSDWKVVSSPHFASYYRIAEKNENTISTKKFRDYFITGELQGEGGYITLDPVDDSKSIMNGKCTNYFKNGKVANERTLINGKEQGEWIIFYENGSINTRANFLNGEPHGLYTQFTEEGLCIQMEYAYGKPKTDYYTVSNDNGLFSKIRISDNKPIWESPSINSKKVDYKDGEAWPYYINDGIMIAMTNTETKDYGRYYRIYIVLTNNSFDPIEFDPTESAAILTDKKGNNQNLEIQTAQQYDKRIKRTQMWEEALVGFANGLAASQAGYSQSTTTSTYSGNSYSSGRASAYGSGGYAYGNYSGSTSYYGSSTSTTQTYDAGAAYQAQLAASQQMAALSESNFQVRQNRNEGYLKRTTINPGESISGYFNVKHKKGEMLDVVLNIAGATYRFPWNVNHK